MANNRPILGCIADDFTGASDLASFLLKGGLRVVQMNGMPLEDDIPHSSCDAIVVALKSRTCPVNEAVSDSLKSLEWLQKQGCTRFYFKYCSTFDSSEKGNIGPVTDALMDALNTQQTILCPALPVNGRTVFFGHLFVNGVPLSESPMANHPLTPMGDSNLMRLMDKQVSDKYTGQCSNLTCAEIQQAGEDDLAVSGRYCVTDTIDSEDLKIIAKHFSTREHFPLLTGGSGLGEYLGENYAKAGWLNDKEQNKCSSHQPGPVLILSGSCSQATREQVDIAKRTLPSLYVDPLSLQNGDQSLQNVIDWLSTHQGQHVLIYCSAAPNEVKKAQKLLGEQKAALLLERCMANIAIQVTKNQMYQKIVVAGGETSGAVVTALALKQFRVGDSISPGVPMLYKQENDDNGSNLILALKSGNFGGPEFFLDAIEKMV